MLGTIIPELDLDSVELTEFWRLGSMLAVIAMSLVPVDDDAG